ncbi:MAG: DeoR/GlpR family DNA-binding transcription regulator [Bacillota bacterium]|nr:DeoR/GlpR family DNA-binding transcription regulator [Bacillota bacterium]
MIREERLARIAEYVQARQYVSIEELMRSFGISKATVRRDLLKLGEGDSITLTRGGAIFNETERYNELIYNEKKSTNPSEKNRIGEAARKLINNDSAVIFDAGTTTRAMIPFMKDLSGINLVTNDIAIAGDLTSFPGINVTVTGGQMRSDYYTLRGYIAEDLISSMRAEIGFVSFDAIDLSSGCYITNSDEVGVKRKIIEVSQKVVALCDYTKFSKQAFVSVCPLSDIDILITNREVPEGVVESLKKSGIEVILT